MYDDKSGRMLDLHFRLMTWAFRVQDLFRDPAKKLDLLPLKPGMRVLDYGCGPGRYDMALAQRVGTEGRVYAIDIHPLAIREVERRARSAGFDSVMGVVVDGYDTGLPDGCADAGIFLDAFFMIPDKQSVLREIHRLLVPGALLLFEPGHMNIDDAMRIVNATGLFSERERKGRDILLKRQ